MRTRPPCKVDGCPRGARYRDGYCRPHWLRVKGIVDPAIPIQERRAEIPPCRIEGCGRRSLKTGLCQGHQMRADRGADLYVVMRRRASPESLAGGRSLKIDMPEWMSPLLAKYAERLKMSEAQWVRELLRCYFKANRVATRPTMMNVDPEWAGGTGYSYPGVD